MSVKRWSEGVDYESTCEFEPEFELPQTRSNPPCFVSPERLAAYERQRRRRRGIRIGSIDHLDLVMDTWATDLQCAVCQRAKWAVAIYVRLNGNLLAFPVCKAKDCKSMLHKDALNENPNIN